MASARTTHCIQNCQTAFIVINFHRRNLCECVFVSVLKIIVRFGMVDKSGAVIIDYNTTLYETDLHIEQEQQQQQHHSI